MKIDVNRVRGIFFEEVAEHLVSLETGLLRLEQSPRDKELLNDIFRRAHSIKGGSAIFDFTDLTNFTHTLENVLGRLRDGVLQPTRPVMDLLLRAADMVKALVAAAQHDTPSPPALASLLTELTHVSETGAVAMEAPVSMTQAVTPDVGAIYQVSFRPGENVLRLGLNPLYALEELAALGEVLDVQVDVSRLPPLTALEPKDCYLSWTVRLRTDKTPEAIGDVFAFFEDDSELLIEPGIDTEPAWAEPQVEAAEPLDTSVPCVDDVAPSLATWREATTPEVASPTVESSSIRVSIDKANKLIDLVGELVISQSMIAQIINNFSPEQLSRLQDAMVEMERNTRELQERVMEVRMLPIGTVFQRFPRLVHDLSRHFGKQISLRLFGEETELDKSVIEQVSDPLTHLIRNAIDHGIESPEARRNAGKPEQGTIRVNAFHQGGSVVVEVSDDGGGLDPQRIRQRAIERGLIRENEELSPEQAQALIFRPGFSTAKAINAISGRGVGLDVVRRNVEAANGSVNVESEPGRGTRFRLKLPLTLAILDGLLLRVGAQVYVLPLTAVVESLRPLPGQVKTVLGQGEVVVRRGECLPLLRLHRLLRLSTEVTDPAQGLMVIVEHEGRLASLLVDDVVGQQQVVIKSLEANFRKIDGIAGATILGDGHVGLILDIAGLTTLARTSAVPQMASTTATAVR